MISILTPSDKTFADTTKDSTIQIQFDTGVSQTIL